MGYLARTPPAVLTIRTAPAVPVESPVLVFVVWINAQRLPIQFHALKYIFDPSEIRCFAWRHFCLMQIPLANLRHDFDPYVAPGLKNKILPQRALFRWRFSETIGGYRSRVCGLNHSYRRKFGSHVVIITQEQRGEIGCADDKSVSVGGIG